MTKDLALERMSSEQGSFILSQAAKYNVHPEEVIRAFYNDANVGYLHDFAQKTSDIVWTPNSVSNMEPVLIARIPDSMSGNLFDDAMTRYNLLATMNQFNSESQWALDWDFEKAGLFEIDWLYNWIPGFNNSGMEALDTFNELDKQLDTIQKAVT